MEQAPNEERIIQQCMIRGLRLPGKIENAPELHMGLGLYYNAYWELTSCRASGWGIGPIPWSAILEYARFFEFSEEQEEDLLYYVRMMDNAYLDYKRSKEEGKCQQAKASTNSQKGWRS